MVFYIFRVPHTFNSAAATENRGHVAVTVGCGEDAISKSPDTRVAGKVIVNKFTGLLFTDADGLAESKRCLAVNDAKIYRFSSSTHFFCNLAEIDTVDLGRHRRVDIMSGGK